MAVKRARQPQSQSTSSSSSSAATTSSVPPFPSLPLAVRRSSSGSRSGTPRADLFDETERTKSSSSSSSRFAGCAASTLHEVACAATFVMAIAFCAAQHLVLYGNELAMWPWSHFAASIATIISVFVYQIRPFSSLEEYSLSNISMQLSSLSKLIVDKHFVWILCNCVFLVAVSCVWRSLGSVWAVVNWTLMFVVLNGHVIARWPRRSFSSQTIVSPPLQPPRHTQSQRVTAEREIDAQPAPRLAADAATTSVLSLLLFVLSLCATCACLLFVCVLSPLLAAPRDLLFSPREPQRLLAAAAPPLIALTALCRVQQRRLSLKLCCDALARESERESGRSPFARRALCVLCAVIEEEVRSATAQGLQFSLSCRAAVVALCASSILLLVGLLSGMSWRFECAAVSVCVLAVLAVYLLLSFGRRDAQQTRHQRNYPLASLSPAINQCASTRRDTAGEGVRSAAAAILSDDALAEKIERYNAMCAAVSASNALYVDDDAVFLLAARRF